MGWDFGYGQTKQELVAYLTKNQERDGIKWEVLAHSVRGNQLWLVIEKTGNGSPVRFIALRLLEYAKEYKGYGYKPMDESVHPYYYDCPLKFLDMAPPSNEEWRKIVREHHARTTQKLALGQIINLTNEKAYKVVGLKPLRAVSLDSGQTYRIPRTMLTLPKPAEPQAVAAPEAAQGVA